MITPLTTAVTVGPTQIEGAAYAETALRAARAAVAASGKVVKAQAIVLRGYINTVLVGESRHAEIMCVGSFGVD
jgi:hypothetical protein